MDNIFIHKGHPTFDPNKFLKIKNIPLFVKPMGGLWGSPIDSSLDWTSFVNGENFNKQKYIKNSFKFKLNTDSVLIIDDAHKLDNLPHLDTWETICDKPMHSFYDELDFEQLAKSYDAMVVLISSDYKLYERLYGWDVDSVLVFNPDVVSVID